MSTRTAVPFVLIEEDWSRLDELTDADDFDFYQIAQPDHWRVNCGGIRLPKERGKSGIASPLEVWRISAPSRI